MILRTKYIPLFFCALAFGSCKNNVHESGSSNRDSIVSKDNHTQSNADSVLLKHLSLDISVDMDKRIISGNATWHIENTSKLKELVLDTYDLGIDSVLTDG